MALSTELITAIQRASSKLDTNTNGELVLPERRNIWRAMGELLLDENRAIKGIGLNRRTKLASLCVEKVLGFWDEAFPADDGPRQMLITANQYLNNAIDYDAAWERKNSYWSKVDDLIYEGKHLAIVNVGFASIKVVTTSLADEVFDPQNPEEDIMDESLDPYEWDASLFASAAYSGGFVWEEQSDKLRRMEFWRWYLSDAIPSSWESYY